MQELINQILGYVRSTWRFRWYAQLVAWPLCLGGLITIYTLPDQYQASARVHVDTQSMLRPLLKGLAVQSDLSQQVELMTRTILSRPNIEQIARMTDMDLAVKTSEEMELLLERLKRKINLKGSGYKNLFNITYTDTNPDLAKRVVQALLTLFVETSLGDSRKDSNVAQSFLDQQIKEYEARLSVAEDRLKEFKQKNVGLMPTEGKGYYSRLQEASATFDNAKLKLKEARKRIDELKRQLEGEEPTFGISTLYQPQMTTSPLDGQIENLQLRLNNLLLKYTDKHPETIAFKQTIDELEHQRQQALEAMGDVSPSFSSLETNPVYQQMKIALGTVQTEAAGLNVRVNEYQARVNQLRKMVNTIPEVEAKLARMNRDYAIHKKQYESFTTRRETAKISQEVGQSSDNVKFKVIDPPLASRKPVAPNRPLFATVVLLGSVVAGLAFAFFLSQIKPTFSDRRMLMAVTQRPLLGYVSLVWDDQTRFKQKLDLFAFSSLSVFLICVYGAFLVLPTVSLAAL